MKRANRRLSLATILVLVAAGSLTVWQSGVAQTQAARDTSGNQLPALTTTSEPVAKTWSPPDVSKIPSGPQGESVRLGMNIFQESPRYAPQYIGNQISCGNCHLQVGTMTNAIALVGVPNLFPQYSARAKKMITLQDRIQECVTRSENGKPLPQDGPEMKGLLDFFDWLATSQPAGQPAPNRGLPAFPDDVKSGDVARGERIFHDKCAGCHGADGAGVPPILPPLWGAGAYNDGAGMNNPRKMAAFVLRNMPQNKPGSLTPQEAFDVASFVASKPHSPYNHAYDIY
jgi:thiosulfate dehydrogenase